MREKIKKLISKANVSFIEVHLEEREGIEIRYVGKELESLNQYIDIGGNVRAFSKGIWSFASFNNFDELESHINFVAREARLGCNGKKGRLAKVIPYVDEVIVKMENDPRKIPINEKVKLAKSYNSRILRSKKIQSSRVTYEDIFQRRFYLNSEGADIVEEKIYCGISFTAIAKDGMNVQMMHKSKGDTEGFHIVYGLEEDAEEVKKDAINLLKAEKVKAGIYTVVADPLLTGVFAHEAFGHLSEADFIYTNQKMQKIMEFGKRFGNKNLNIVDDGSIRGKRGSYKYDDEGVRSRKNYLVKNGILVGRLHSRESADIMREKPTGNARAISYQFPPIVRMSNTYILKGKMAFDELIGEVEEGIYAVSALGGQTELEMFTFSSSKAYLIKDGKIGPMVRDVVLSGNVFETLKNIDGIGSDVSMHGGLGGCGKDGQMPLPVSDGGPHIRIRNVVIGGK
ncbi:MAG: TldD/PmbA family protein [Candidatus Cloacimonadota bacterium]|nr:MAG: TldD/PmbA family protein [Candidatus Cloacimonadota bacterium]